MAVEWLKAKVNSGGRTARLAFLTAVVVSAALAACGDSATDVRGPTDLALQVVSGDSQVGPPFEELPEPIVVRVVDARDGSPVTGQIVNFVVVEGGGSVFAGAALTNAQGIAQEYWTLGAPGPQELEARAVGPNGEKLVFGSVRATAVEPVDSIPALIQCIDSTGSWQFPSACGPGSTAIGSVLRVRFRVVNAAMLPVPNVTMRFSTFAWVPDSVNHPGTVRPREASTDGAGIVPVTWTLDSLPGTYFLSARVERPDTTFIRGEVSVRAYVPGATAGSVVSWTNAAGGRWSDSTNWDLGRVPTPNDTALITLPGTYTVTVSGAAGAWVHGLEVGSPDSSERTLLIDHTSLQLDASGVVHTGGAIDLVGATAFGAIGQVRISGGEVRVSDAAWRLYTPLASGTFTFGGASPIVLGSRGIVASGGAVIWRNADTLLMLADSAALELERVTFTLETPAVIVPAPGVRLFQRFGGLRFFADSTEATSLALYDLEATINGTVYIVELVAPAAGTALDLLRLENGATLTGSATMGTTGYTLIMNPEVGVGLRAVKN